MALDRRRLGGYCADASIALGRLVLMLPYLFWASVCCEPLWAPAPLTAAATEASPRVAAAAPEASPAAANSGIYGAMVAAWGNAPAKPPTYVCVRIFDAGGQKLVATGTCSGIWGQFRVPLAPGHYIVEKGRTHTVVQGVSKFVPQRTTVDVGPGQWVNLAPRPLPGPVP